MADDDAEIEMPDDYVGGAPVSAGDVTTFEWPPPHWGFSSAPGADTSTPPLTGPPGVTLPWASGPVTDPSQLPSETEQPPSPPVTSPSQVEPGEHPITSPSETPDSMPQESPESVQASGMTKGQEDEIRARAADPAGYAGLDATRATAAKIQMYKDKAAADADLARQTVADHQAFVANFAKTQQDTAAMLADAQRLATTKLDPERYWHSRSSGQKIALGLASILGGAAGGYLGTGRNVAMEQLNRSIEEDIEAQKHDINNAWRGIDIRKGAIADEYARHGDLDRASTAFRQAQYQQAINKIDTDMQLVDPNGQIARSYIDARNQFALAQQANQQAFEKRRMDNLKAQADVAKDLTEAKNPKHGIGLQNPALERELGFSPVATGGGGTGVPAPPIFGNVYKSMNDIPPKHQDNAFALPGGGFAVANNKTNAEDLEHLGKSYAQIHYDLNELQRIALERKGAKSIGGSVWKKWEDTQEQHYDQLTTDFLQQYALILHGRSPTKGVIEEVVHSGNVGLKGALERGDVRELLGNFHDDIQNRTLEQLKPFAGDTFRLPNDRPAINEENLNTRKAWMTAPPVKGDKGYSRFDVGNFAQGLNANVTEYTQNPGLGGNKELSADLDDQAAAQRKAAAVIRDEIARLQKKKTPTAAERDQLAGDRLALKDREEAVRTVEEMRNKNLEQLRAAEVSQKAQEDLKKAIESRGTEH